MGVRRCCCYRFIHLSLLILHWLDVLLRCLVTGVVNSLFWWQPCCCSLLLYSMTCYCWWYCYRCWYWYIWLLLMLLLLILTYCCCCVVVGIVIVALPLMTMIVGGVAVGRTLEIDNVCCCICDGNVVTLLCSGGVRKMKRICDGTVPLFSFGIVVVVVSLSCCRYLLFGCCPVACCW